MSKLTKPVGFRETVGCQFVEIDRFYVVSYNVNRESSFFFPFLVGFDKPEGSGFHFEN